MSVGDHIAVVDAALAGVDEASMDPRYITLEENDNATADVDQATVASDIEPPANIASAYFMIAIRGAGERQVRPWLLGRR